MSGFDQLKITPGESINALNWNALIEKVENLKLEIAPNLSRSSLTLSQDSTENQDRVSLSIDSTTANLKIKTEYGQLTIGPKDPEWAHIETDREKFYFNKEIRVDSGKVGSYNEDLNLCTEGNSNITIKKNGYVGIGTTSPKEKLHINGSIRGNQGAGALRIQTDKGLLDIGPKNNTYTGFYTDSKKKYFYFNKEVRVDTGKIGSHNEHLYLCVRGKPSMILKTDGKVGIGLPNPKFNVHMKGTLTLDDKSSSERGWIVLKGHANHSAARAVLNKLGKEQLLLAGCDDDKVYFYWKDKGGKKRCLEMKYNKNI